MYVEQMAGQVRSRICNPNGSGSGQRVTLFSLHYYYFVRCVVWGISSSNCSPLSVRGSVAQWRRTQCANCSEPRFDSRQEKNFLCHILKVMPQYPYGEPGVSVAWSHLGMRTGNSANEGDRLGRGRIPYGMGVAAENLTFCRRSSS